ncbi:MAG: hypothetical protein ABIO44_11705 [Saprospiraceae bacterium]
MGNSIFSILIYLGFNHFVFSQCDLKVWRDEFNNKLKVESKFDNNSQFSLAHLGCEDCFSIGQIGFYKVDENLYFKVRVSSSTIFSVSVGDSAFIKFTDGTILKMVSTTSGIADIESGTIKWWYEYIYYYINKEDALSILNKEPFKIRYDFTNKRDHSIFTKKGKKRFIDRLNCMYSLESSPK